ncbi:MAG: hypothetical protein N2517_01785 [Ignavibacteria bacterium]|nr:hypothetical protein [Ignavibacteria bacterium]
MLNAFLIDFADGKSQFVTKLIESFVDGLKKGGANVEILKVGKVQISKCRSCTEDLFFVSNGDCKCLDEFSSFYGEFKKSNLWVFALDITNKLFLEDFNNVLNRMEPLFRLKSNPKKKKLLASLIFSKGRASIANNISKLIEDFAILYDYQYLGSVVRNDYGVIELLPQKTLNEFAFETDFLNLGYDLTRLNALSPTITERVARNIRPENSFINEISKLLGEI